MQAILLEIQVFIWAKRFHSQGSDCAPLPDIGLLWSLSKVACHTGMGGIRNHYWSEEDI